MSGLTVTIPARCLALDRNEIQQLPPSARRVYAAILDAGPASLPDLQHFTGLPRRTVAYGISRLKDARLVSWHQRLDDYRVRYFSVHPRLVHATQDGCQDAQIEGAIIQVARNRGPPSLEVAKWLHDR